MRFCEPRTRTDRQCTARPRRITQPLKGPVFHHQQPLRELESRPCRREDRWRLETQQHPRFLGRAGDGPRPRERHERGSGEGPVGNLGEGLLEPLLCFCRIEIAHQTTDRVRRRIVLGVEAIQIAGAHGAEIGFPPGRLPSIAVALEGHGEEGIGADGERTSMVNPLLEHHVTLGAELAKDRRGKALSFCGEPEVELLARKVTPVGGGVLVGPRVDPHVVREHQLGEGVLVTAQTPLPLC